MQRDRQARSGKTDGISLPAKVRVKDFRRLIYNSRSRFKERLEKFISSLAESNVFQNAQRVLCGKEPFQLPPALAVDMARRSPEVLFLLIYRLHIGEEIAFGSEEHRQVLGFLTALSWFGRGERLRDHDPCLRHLWRDLLTCDTKPFWRRSVLQKTIKPYNDQLVMLPLLPPARLSKFLMVWIVERGTEWDELPEPPSNSFVARWLGRYYQSREQHPSPLMLGGSFCARSRRSAGLYCMHRGHSSISGLARSTILAFRTLKIRTVLGIGTTFTPRI